jgi:hypothetical protein
MLAQLSRRKDRTVWGKQAYPEFLSSVEDALVYKCLQRRDTFNFSNCDLSTVINYFERTYGFNISVDWNELALADVTRSTPVEVRLSNVKVEAALRTILEYVRSSNELDFDIRHGLVHITTAHITNSLRITRVYNVSDILRHEPAGRLIEEVRAVWDRLESIRGVMAPDRSEANRRGQLPVSRATASAHRPKKRSRKFPIWAIICVLVTIGSAVWIVGSCLGFNTIHEMFKALLTNLLSER